MCDFRRSFKPFSFPFTDSGIQSVGDSSIRGSSDSMGGSAQQQQQQQTQQQQQQQPMEVDAPGTSSSSGGPNFVSLVEQGFGGKMMTSYECSDCQSVSIHKEVFTELHLAIPDPNATAGEGEGKAEDGGHCVSGNL